MIATLMLAGLIVWIIKDHEAVMTELKATRDSYAVAKRSQ